jgi:hypothetical protein
MNILVCVQIFIYIQSISIHLLDKYCNYVYNSFNFSQFFTCFRQIYICEYEYICVCIAYVNTHFDIFAYVYVVIYLYVPLIHIHYIHVRTLHYIHVRTLKVAPEISNFMPLMYKQLIGMY